MKRTTLPVIASLLLGLALVAWVTAESPVAPTAPASGSPAVCGMARACGVDP